MSPCCHTKREKTLPATARHTRIYPLLLLGIALSLTKLYLLEIRSREFLDCQWCVSAPATANELQFIVLIGLLVMAAGLPRQRPLRVGLRVVVVAIVVIMILDLGVFYQFLQRFTLHRLLKFGSEVTAIDDFLKIALSETQTALMALGALIVTLTIFGRFLTYDYLFGPRKMLPAVFSVCLVGTQFLESDEFHTPYLLNSVEAFFAPYTRFQPYSEDFKEAIRAMPSEPQYCVAGRGERPNLILLVVESLSMYQSSLYSGIKDWVPQFDNTSRAGRRYSAFYANGVTTEQGLISLLTGEPAVEKGVEGNTEFDEFRSTPQTIPRMLGGLGYRTEFLTTGNLGFLKKGDWLKNIGFEYVEGHDAHYYDGMKRYHFDAAPDDALYGRALQELQSKSGSPIFMMLETVTTHHPYVEPATGKHSQEAAFRYADQQLGKFVDALKQRKFFSNGYLMIVGDHRAMVPMIPEEKRLFGDRGFARIPFTIVGHAMQGQNEPKMFSQTDLLPSLRHWIGTGQQCFNPNQGIFLPNPIHPPACIFTHRSYNFDNVFVHCGNEDHVIKLDGDRTRFATSNGGSPELIEEVHRLRAGLTW